MDTQIAATNDTKRGKIPVILLTGWLGSGKTSVLNSLLADTAIKARKPALIVNEFGEIGVDARLIDSGSSPVCEINKGSLFCICTKVDFVAAMLKIRDESDCGLVLVEATGVAEAIDLETLLDERILGGAFSVEAVICVVDAAGFATTAAFSRSVANQVRCADLLVINKTDLKAEAELDQLQKLISEMNTEACILQTANGKLDSAKLAHITHIRRTGHISSGPPADIVSVSISDDRQVSRQEWDTCLSSLGDKILRLKGNVSFTDGAKLVEISISTRSESAPLENHSSKSTAFAVIARAITAEALREKLQSIFV